MAPEGGVYKTFTRATTLGDLPIEVLAYVVKLSAPVVPLYTPVEAGPLPATCHIPTGHPASCHIPTGHPATCHIPTGHPATCHATTGRPRRATVHPGGGMASLYQCSPRHPPHSTLVLAISSTTQRTGGRHIIHHIV